MKKIGIQTPCKENWANMSPTSKGAFCQSCTKEVVDFSNKTNNEIKRILLENGTGELCGRMTLQQDAQLNSEFDLWKLTSQQQVRRISLYVFIFVFGLSIVSCADEQDKVAIRKLQQSTQQILIDPIPQEGSEVVVPESKMIEELEIVENKLTDCNFPISEHTLEPTVEHKVIQHTMGAMVSTREYLKYAEETLLNIRYDEFGIEIPSEFSGSVYPNPTNGMTTLKIATPETIKATIVVFSSKGELILNIGENTYREGTTEIEIDLTNEQSGTYLVQFISQKSKEIYKVMKL